MRAEPIRPLPVPPHSIEAEQAVLGSLLIDGKAWSLIAGKIASAQFYRPGHRVIFASMESLARAGHPTDLVMVSEYLERAGQTEAIGGLAYLGQIARNTPTAAHVEHYCTIVRERAVLRSVGSLGQQIERDISSGEYSGAELIARLQGALLDMQASTRVGKGLISSRELAAALVDDLDRRCETPSGLSVGLADFDELTGGLEPGDLAVIAARPGMGKTALLISIADYVSQHVPTAVFSAEMPAQQLMRRAVAKGAGVSQGLLRRADGLSAEDWKAIGSAIDALGDRRLSIDETALPSLSYIRAETLSLKARDGLGLVMVDYVQLVTGQGRNRYEELREVAYGLKALAKDLAVPVMVLAQLNRGVESRDQKRPYLSDLRDSGAIEEAADLVGLLFSEGYYDPQFGMPYVLECAIEKNRNGERGQCLWHFSGAHSRVTVLESGAHAQYRHLMEKRRHKGSHDDL